MRKFMVEFEWYLELLDQNDLAVICKWFNLPVQGFKNPDKAPYNILNNVVRASLTKGNLIKQKKKHDAITYEELLNRVATETSRHENWLDLSFQEFLYKSQLLLKFKPFRSVALLYENFPEKYQTNLELMKKNALEKDEIFIFSGFEGYEEKPILSQIESLLQERSISPFFYLEKTKNHIELFLSEEELAQYNDFVALISTAEMNDDITCLKMLYETVPKYRNIFLLAYLHVNQLVDKEEYKSIALSLENYLKAKYEDLSTQKLEYIKAEKSLFKQQSEEVHNDLIETQSCLEQLKADLLNKNIIIKEQKTAISQMGLRESSHKIYADYFKYMVKKVENSLIVTGGNSNELGPYFEEFVLSVKELNQIKKEKNIERLKDKTIFIARIAYSSSQKWNEITQFIHKHNIKMVELDGYNELEFLDTIITSLEEEEKVYYDDYYN